MKLPKTNQEGALDITILIAIVAVVLVGGFAFWRIQGNDSEQSSVETTEQSDMAETLPENIEGLKTIEEIQTIAGASDTVTVVTAELESEDGKYVYKVVLSDGRKLVINATTGEVLSEESSDSEDSDSTKVTATITLSQANSIAKSKHTSSVKKIELEQEDTKATYKVEYVDGSKLEIDATTGAIVKSEIKGQASQSSQESENESEDDSQDDEDGPEDKSDEDSDDSVDDSSDDSNEDDSSSN